MKWLLTLIGGLLLVVGTLERIPPEVGIGILLLVGAYLISEGEQRGDLSAIGAQIGVWGVIFLVALPFLLFRGPHLIWVVLGVGLFWVWRLQHPNRPTPSDSTSDREGESDRPNPSSPPPDQPPAEELPPLQNPHLLQLEAQFQALLNPPPREWVVAHLLEEIGKLWGRLLRQIESRGVTTTQLAQLTSYIEGLAQVVQSYRQVEGRLSQQELGEFIQLLEELRKRMLDQLLQLPTQQVGEFRQELELLRRQLDRWATGGGGGNSGQ